MGTFGITISMMMASVNLVADMPEADSPETAKPAPIVQQMLERNNELRASVGLEPHQLSKELTAAAQDHAEYMAQTGQFSHYVNGGPWDRAARHGYNGSVRENIAMGYADVTSAFVAWQNSGGHWASIVSGTTDAGFGYAVGPGGTPYWVGVYGYPTQTVAKPVVDGEEQTSASDSNEELTYTYNTRRSRRRLIGRRRR